MAPALKGARGRMLAAGAGAAGLLLAAAPALAQGQTLAPVEQTQLSQGTFESGTLTRADGALAGNLWRGAVAADLETLLRLVPARPSGPAHGEALRRVLLSPGEAPDGAGAELGGLKLSALVRAGFGDEARTIAGLSNAPRTSPSAAEALVLADLLDGATADACRRNAGLLNGRDAPFWMKLRVYCHMAANERDAADLTLTVARERGALSAAEESLLTALVLGAKPPAAAAPETALDLAILRAMKADIAPARLDRAEAGVLKAIARDGAISEATRVRAAQRAAGAGAMNAGELAGLYRSFPMEPQRIAAAASARSDDPMADVVLYRSAAEMAAPEFLRDKAGRIAAALTLADRPSRLYAAAILFDADIRALDGALVPPAEAAQFARARMAVGDADGAARWLFAMTSDTGGLSEEDAETFLSAVALLAHLDPVAAELASERARLSAPAPSAGPANPGAADPARLARVLRAAFGAARGGSAGQAGLAAVAAWSDAAAGDPYAEVIVAESLRAAGLDGLNRRMRFEAALRVRLSDAARPTAPDPVDQASPAAVSPPPAAAGGPAAPVAPSATTAPAAGEAAAFVVKSAPRVKPRKAP